MSIFSKILGDPNEKALKKLEPIVASINAAEASVKKLSDSELKARSEDFKKRLKGGETLDDILPEAYACVREAAFRSLQQRHYDVQLIGGIALHQGRIAEMRTGEGKTLASTLPVYLNALSGKGAHVVTVNDYLSRRDTVWMGQIYDALGLTVGCINHDTAYLYDTTYKKDENQEENRDEERDSKGSFRIEESYLRPVERREAYRADITYGTNNEFGFDYLRDNLVQKLEQKVQRGFHYAIIDEVDSILIDEARTPLIISAPDAESTDLYKKFAQLVVSLKEGSDYNVDFKMRSVSISEDGIEKIEKALGIENIYDPASGGGIRYVHNLEQALRAKILFTLDKDYVVKEGEVIIVDEFTGRLMPGRRYSEGLHQAIEAKEGVQVQRESRTLASVSFQNYFRMYKKLAGMTGTAVTNAEEFDRVYKLEVIVVPTNKPMIRKYLRDLVFRTESGKFKAVVQEIKRRHKTGQPVLVGTTSIEKNEYLGKFLEREGVQFKLLNAKNHTQEAQIIAQAGREGAVTVATNMAGRGVDIILGGNPFDSDMANRVKKLGGLHVIGTERHDARRIDNQLRGRSGRQGDPGSSQFYLSLEDNLMKVFGGDRIQKLMATLKMPEDQPIESRLVSGAIESAQSKIEGFNFDTRKHLLDYDEVLNKHRETIYKKRDQIMAAVGDESAGIITGYLVSYIDKLCDSHLAEDYSEDWNIEELFEELKATIHLDDAMHKQLEQIRSDNKDVNAARDKIRDFIYNKLKSAYKEKEEKFGADTMRDVERWALIRTIDTFWMDHLEAMEHMRDSVRLRAYAQRDPLVEYKNEGLRMFRELEAAIENAVVTTIFKVDMHEAPQHPSHPHVHMHSTPPSAGGVKTDTSASSKGQSSSVAKVGRNEPCPCGSGKKYKKCHGKS